MSSDLSRREFLRLTAASATAAAFSASPAAALTAPGSVRPSAFRFVHLTDIHVQREREGDKGFAQALRAVEALRPRPDFILTGGDLVFDVLEVGPQRARELFDLYRQIIADHTSLKVYNTIGNHDVFGWSARSGVNPGDAGYGKALVKDRLALPETYYRFDHKGWRFFVLDNIQPADRQASHVYEGYLNEPQFDWLAAELGRTPAAMPIVICEHIPIVTVTPFGHDRLNDGTAWKINNSLVCSDSARRLELIRTRRVRLCLSGHIHERDRVEFGGTSFINDGAVSGAWWKGPHRGVEEGFGVFDLRADGSFDYRYLDYGWEARPEREATTTRAAPAGG